MPRITSTPFVFIIWMVSCFKASNGLITSIKNPISLNMRLAPVNDTGFIKLPKSETRTKELFFEDALGLVRGRAFTFNIDNWRAIQRSGLFRNLSATAHASDDGQVTLSISGEELPSIRFSPEVSVATSLVNPEVAGGVSFGDKNFRGLGQKLDIQIAKKEGKERGTDDLTPTIFVKWSDNNIGKATKISAVYEDESVIHDAADIIPQAMVGKVLKTGLLERNRIGVNIRKAFARFRNTDFLSFAKNHYERYGGDDVKNPLMCHLDATLEPYYSAVAADTKLYGGKFVATANWNSGVTTTYTQDGGKGYFPWGSAAYNQVLFETGSPLMKVLGDVRGRLRSTVSPAIDVNGKITNTEKPASSSMSKASSTSSAGFGLSLPSNLKLGTSPVDSDPSEDTTKVTSSMSGPLQLMCKIKNKFMTSWGGACLPLLHSTCLGDSLTVRSVTDEPSAVISESLGAHRKRARSYVATKIDFYLEGVNNMMKPGFFLDAAVFKANSASKVVKSSALDLGLGLWKTSEIVPGSKWEAALGAGLSLRAFGFRTDVAWPIINSGCSSGSGGGRGSKNYVNPPRVHVGVDLGD